MKVGDIILVCDVGGGTTDFTLIAVTDEGGDLALSRLAVGEHILLGGDNMDLALAYAVAATLPAGHGRARRRAARRAGTRLPHRQGDALHRPEEERGPGGRARPGLEGHRRIGQDGADPRDARRSVLLDGFLPRCAPTDLPARGRRVGLTEIGLPYAADPAITRHLARFLGQQAGSLHTGGATVMPSAVLFNGGVFKAAELRGAGPRRALGLGRAARPRAGVRRPRPGRGPRSRLLRPGPRGQGGPDPGRRAAVVLRRRRDRGAGRPGRRRRRSRPCAWCRWGWRKGPRPTSPAPSSAWSSASPPSSGSSARPPAATTRSARSSTAGSPRSSRRLAPLETALAAEDGDSGETVPVRLHSHVTEVGTLELWCQSTRDQRRWKLEFNVRESPEVRTDRKGHLSTSPEGNRDERRRGLDGRRLRSSGLAPDL